MRWTLFLFALVMCYARVCPDTRARNRFLIPAKTHTPGMPSGSTLGVPTKMSVCELYDLHQYCVDKINWYRTTRPTFTDGRSPTFATVGAVRMLDTPFLQCHNEKAMSDLQWDKAGNGCGHFTAGATCAFATTSIGSSGTENSCCKRSCTTQASCKSTLDGCLRQMYDEGQLVLDGVSEFGRIGHYLNMVGNHAYLTCGFGFDDANDVYMTQNFYGDSSASKPCTYNCAVSTSVSNECQSPYARCDGISYCTASSQCTSAPQCFASQGTCTNGRCAYTTPVATCQAGTCDANQNCVQTCADPKCSHCTASTQGSCDACSSGKLDSGCCVTDCVKVVDSSWGGTYIAGGFSDGQISYFNSANSKWLAFYCCGWGWAITTAASGGSVYKRSDFTAGDARASSGKWSGSTNTQVLGCYTACLSNPACDTPPECYQLPGTCGACGCTYSPKASGAACNGGTCNGAGLCVAGSPPCPTLNAPTGSTSSACTNVAVGSTCTFSCASGSIKTGGDLTRTCMSGQTWGGSALVCTATCPSISSPANAVSKTCTNFTPTQVCTFACNANYVDNGQLSRTCTQGPTPSWSGSAASCTLVATCPSLAPPTNGQGTACTNYNTGTCTFSCATGFQQKSGTDLARTCSNGAWGGSALVCEPIPCPTLASPALATTATCSGKVHGDTCQFACVYGASATAGTTIRTCTAGAWTPTAALVCSWNACPTLNSPQNAVTKSCANQIHSNTCAFACNTGFAPATGQTYTCDNGVWTPASALVCTALVCPDLAAPSGATAASCNGKTEGFVCTFACSGTNVASGSASRTCSNGAWTGTSFSCAAPAQCPTLNPPTFSSSAACTGFINGQICTQTCKVGYTQTGGPRTCSPPNWSGTAVSCTPIACPSLEGPPNTIATTCSGKVEEDTCTFVCDVGYTGSFTKTCKNGSWTGSELFCSAKICPTLSAPLHSSSAACANKIQLQTCTLGCDVGYTPKTVTRTCSDGAWTGTDLTCSALVCPDLLPSAFSTGTSCLQKTQGAVCTFACQATYTSNGKEARTCNDGAWSGTPLTCTAPNKCPDLSSPAGADKQVCTAKIAGEACTFACTAGYTGSGDATRLCGSDGQWAGVAFQCKPKPCPLISAPSGALTASCASKVEGDLCAFQCLSGYSSNGFESRTCTDGTWSGSPLACSPIPCPDLVAPSGAAIASCIGKVEGDTCTFACDAENTTTVGDPVRICRSGTWTGQQLQCPLNTARYAYTASDWSMCPVSCGSALQTRVVNCVDTQDGNKITAITNCKDLHPIDAAQTCPNPATVCPKYSWTIGAYGACSKMCGSGESTRSVTCTVKFDTMAGGVVTDDKCAGEGPAPLSTMQCNTDPCVAGTNNWVSLPFGECSATCGGGTQTRVVQCQDSLANVVPDANCTAARPASSMTCNTGGCKVYSWQVCNWTDCTASCDTSMQSEKHRDVWCSSFDTTSGTAQTADESFCLTVSPKPNGMLTGCNLVPCTTFNWMTTPWTACVGGVKTRTAHCHAADQTVALNSACPADLQPILSMPCQLFKCNTEPQVFMSFASHIELSAASFLFVLWL